MDDQNLTLERRLAACLEREKSKSVLRRLNIQLEAENERLQKFVDEAMVVALSFPGLQEKLHALKEGDDAD